MIGCRMRSSVTICAHASKVCGASMPVPRVLNSNSDSSGSAK